jgi:uncharacterized protein (TIGR03437 family)
MQRIRQSSQSVSCAGSTALQNCGDGGAVAFSDGVEPVRRARRTAYGVLLLGAAMVIAAPAQTFTTLVNFNGANGANPEYVSLVQGTDGNFYGTTSKGGTTPEGVVMGNGGSGLGAVFKMTPSGTLTTLYTFDPNDQANNGALPMAGLVQGPDGNFYGTTQGLAGYGSVFKITSGGALTTLHIFSNTGTDGANPEASLVQGADGNFYGTTVGGGGSGNGTVFKITPSGALTTLHSFCMTDCSDGSNPMGWLIQATDGNFYGTASAGGLQNQGVVFRLTPAGSFATLYTFLYGGVGGQNPVAGLLQAKDGNFYGTTGFGGAKAAGAVFRLTPAGAMTTLYSFCSQPNCSDGANPKAGLIQAIDGNLYGTTFNGGAYSYGTVFGITLAGGLTTRHSFGSQFDSDGNNVDGENPVGGLVQGRDGKLYGTTPTGGTGYDSNGTVFSFTLPSTTSSAPAISSGGIVSASAFGGFTAVAPGSWIEIYGTNLAADSRSWTGADFTGVNAPTSLDGTSVTIGSQRAFIDYISPTQVNAQVPSNAGTGPQPVIVNTAAGASAALTLTVNTEEPGLPAPASFKVGGTQYVAALFSDGATFVLPTGAISGVTSRPAKPGEVITLYGVGFGSVTPNIPAGQVVQQSNTLAAPFHVLFGGAEATVQYDGLAPSAVGLYQFNVVVPNVTASNAVPLTFTLAGVAGTQTLYIAVQN